MALIEKLKNIANAIRSKTNKTEGLTLEQMASAIEELIVGELDFGNVYDQEQADRINQYYKDGIAYAEEIKKNWNNPKNGSSFFKGNNNIVFCPSLDFSNTTMVSNMFNLCSNMVAISYIYSDVITNAQGFFYLCSSLVNLKINIPNNTNATYIIYGCMTMVNAELGYVPKVTTFLYAFTNCYALINLRILEWKQADISLAQSSKLSDQSLKYIIWHSLNGNNTLGFENQGATSRTLQLHATPYSSWEEWKLTKPSVEDCEYLGVSEDEITKYGELTWEDIALDIKLITIAK